MPSLELPLDALGKRADNIADRADQGTDRNTDHENQETGHLKPLYRFRIHHNRSTSWFFMTLRLSGFEAPAGAPPIVAGGRSKPGAVQVVWSPSVGHGRPVSVSCMLLYTESAKKFQTIFRLARKSWKINERFFGAGFNSCAPLGQMTQFRGHMTPFLGRAPAGKPGPGRLGSRGR